MNFILPQPLAMGKKSLVYVDVCSVLAEHVNVTIAAETQAQSSGRPSVGKEGSVKYMMER